MAYKIGPEIKTTVGAAVSDAFLMIQELRDEVSENADNCEGKPSEEAWRNAADELDGAADSEPDVPAELADLEVSYHEQVNKDKRRGPSRAVRLSNAVAQLQAVKDLCDNLEDDEGESAEALKEAAGQLSSDLDDAINLDGSVDFPGMYG